MAVHNPTSTTYANGVIEISSLVNFTYDEILESLSNNNYLLLGIYIKSLTPEQLLELLSFISFDVNGNAIKTERVPTIDPTQYQNSLFLNFQSDDYVFDGRTFIDYFLLANEQINLYLITKKLGTTDLLPKSDFFNDFSNKIMLE